MDQDAGRDAVDRVVIILSNDAQYREAISRLRFLEGAAKDSSHNRERDALELAVSRYLMLGGPASQGLKDQRG